MNTPNPLVPQGSFVQPSRAKSTVRIAVLTIVAIHAVFFAGLLMQGCKRDDPSQSANKSSDLGMAASDLAKLDTNYYQPLPEPLTPTNLTAGGPSSPSQEIPPALSQTSPPVTIPPVSESFSPAPPEMREYTIVKNDTLSKIAKAQHVTVGELTRANPGLDPRRLMAGKKINIPVSTRSSATSATAPAELGFTEPPKPEPRAAAVHVVKRGETLTKIARQYGVTIKALKAANGLRTDRLLVNQKLKLPAAAASAPAGGTSGDNVIAPATTTLSATNPAGAPTVR
jgi:LysM repeat protein